MDVTRRVAFSGHRPDKLGGYDPAHPLRRAVRGWLREHLAAELAWFGEGLTVVTGGALGVDTDAARAAAQLGIPFEVYVPFVGQQSRWPAESQETYRRMLAAASRVEIVSDGGYSARAMQVRNEAMVIDSDVLVAVWDGSPGGTANCVGFARKRRHPVIVCDPKQLLASV